MDERLKQLTEVTGSPTLHLCWLGNLGWLIGSGGRLIATDLDLLQGIRKEPSPISVEDIAPNLDVHFITHEHEDHFHTETCSILVDKSPCLFVVPENCMEKARSLGLPDHRIHCARPTEAFSLQELKVLPFHALHGDDHFAVYREANMMDCGYLLEIGGFRLFQPGDTVLLQQHFDLVDIDVLFVSPTVHNMYTDRAATLINEIKPRHIYPQHFGTYEERPEWLFWTRGYPDELARELPPEMRQRFQKPVQGEVLRIEKTK